MLHKDKKKMFISPPDPVGPKRCLVRIRSPGLVYLLSLCVCCWSARSWTSPGKKTTLPCTVYTGTRVYNVRGVFLRYNKILYRYPFFLVIPTFLAGFFLTAYRENSVYLTIYPAGHTKRGLDIMASAVS